MKISPLFLAFWLILPGCSDRQTPARAEADSPARIASDEELGRRLPGVWQCEAAFLQTDFHSITTVATNGSYTSKITVTKSNITTTVNLAGTWGVRDGCLIDTITNTSDVEIQSRIPYASDNRIVRMDDRGLALLGNERRAFRRMGNDIR